MIEPPDGDGPYRPCVGIMLLNSSGLVFVGQRINATGPQAWQMPQGGIDEGETPRAAAFRELEEEIGTAKAELLAEHDRWLAYDLPPDLVGRVWNGQYRGQTQKWFALRFTGVDTDIDLETAHPEFASWRWERMDRLPDLTISFKQEIYREVVAAFGHLSAAQSAEG